MLSRKPEFVRLWQSEGPKLVAAAEAISGKDFPSQEIKARLTLCTAPSESFPGEDRVTINMRYALKEVIAADSALPGGYYKRAWEFVNATDKEYLKYVAELSK